MPTSLPFDIQHELACSVREFENIHIMCPDYAVEYDFFDLRDLKFSLETQFH